MDPVYAALRLVHVVSGAFWFGVTFMLILFVGPAARAAGQRLTTEALRASINASVVLTVLSGAALYWRDSGGLQVPAWMISGAGLAFGIGGIAGLLAMLVRLVISWPADRRLARLGGPGQSSPEGRRTLATQRLAGRVTAVLLLLSLVLMALARAL